MYQHEILKKFISGLAKGYSNSLIVVSPAGYGKTETTIETMKELGYQEGRNYRYVSNYVSPCEFFNLLVDINYLQEPKILILDDVEEILREKRILGILKGALWEIDGKRKINWFSGTYKIKNKEVDFQGKIIFLLNEFNKKSALLKAVADRGLFYEIKLTIPEMFELMKKRANEEEYQGISKEKRIEIVQFLQRSTNNNQDITLRLLPKAYNLFLLSPNHWQKLVFELL